MRGNLNTAALTLFQSLHLSVTPELPWLILDDPVQSMDELHVAQFAALLRTLAKGENRQITIAVHEKQLFDYLTLELSPAFPGDRVITVEVTKTPERSTQYDPQVYGLSLTASSPSGVLPAACAKSSFTFRSSRVP